MNIFEELVERLKQRLGGSEGTVMRLGKPLDRTGYWTFSMVFDDDFLLSIAWNRYSGFMVTSGFDVPFGGSYDELYSNADALFERAVTLVEGRCSTNFEEPVGLAELRKLLGIKQSDLAKNLDMTNSGLSQLEADSDVLAMKLGTIKKLVDSLGANLVLTARFPDGRERDLAIN